VGGSPARAPLDAWRRSEHGFDAAEEEQDAWLEFETWIDDVDFLFPHGRRLPRVFNGLSR
jgi:hypothetical protein